MRVLRIAPTILAAAILFPAAALAASPYTTSTQSFNSHSTTCTAAPGATPVQSGSTVYIPCTYQYISTTVTSYTLHTPQPVYTTEQTGNTWEQVGWTTGIVGYTNEITGGYWGDPGHSVLSGGYWGVPGHYTASSRYWGVTSSGQYWGVTGGGTQVWHWGDCGYVNSQHADWQCYWVYWYTTPYTYGWIHWANYGWVYVPGTWVAASDWINTYTWVPNSDWINTYTEVAQYGPVPRYDWVPTYSQVQTGTTWVATPDGTSTSSTSQTMNGMLDATSLAGTSGSGNGTCGPGYCWPYFLIPIPTNN